MRRNSSTLSFNSPAPRNTDNDMILAFTTDALVSNNTVCFPIGTGVAAAAAPGSIANQTAMVMNVAGTLSTLYVRGNTNAATSTETFSIEKNGSVGAITCNSAIGANFAQDLTHSIGVVKGDLISVHHSLSGSANFAEIAGTLTFIPS